MPASRPSRRLVPRLLVGLTALAVAAVLGSAAAAQPAQAATAPPEYEVSGSTFVENGLAGVAVDPDRDLVYVAARNEGAVHVLDGDTLAQLRSIPVPNEPYNLALGPGGVLYTSQYTGNNTAGTISVILPEGTAPAATLPVGKSPVGVTVSRDKTRLYVANGSDSFISVFDISTPSAPAPLPPITTPGHTETITASADGQRLYAADNSSSVYVIDVGTGAVSSWNVGNNSNPHQVVLTADESRAVVTAQTLSTPAILNATTGVTETRLPLDYTYYASEDPGLNSIFVTAPWSDSGTVTIIDRTTGELVQNLTGVTTAYYVATNPLTHATYASSFGGTLTKITPVAPNIGLTDPADQTVADGEAATFTAALSGAVVDSVAWETRDDSSGAWTPVPGSSSSSYVVDAAALADSGSQYRAVFTAAGQTWTTNAATLTVTPVAPFVITDPTDQQISDGTQATFASSAGGSSPLLTQWERSNDDGQTWTPIPAATEPTYTATFTHADQGALFRAVFTNDAGTVESSAARLSVLAPPTPEGGGTTEAEPGHTTSPKDGGALAITGGTPATLALALGGVLLLSGIAIALARRARRTYRA